LLTVCLAAARFFSHRLPQRNLLLVLNCHRIGNPDEDPFDPGVFPATDDQLNEPITYLKRHLSLVTLEVALTFVERTAG
jgi:hypothetical protein